MTEEMILSSEYAKYDRITRDYAQTFGMGASGAAQQELLPGGSIMDASGT